MKVNRIMTNMCSKQTEEIKETLCKELLEYKYGNFEHVFNQLGQLKP